MRHPGRAPIWTHNEVEQARAMRDDRPDIWSHQALADWFGCHVGTMKNWLNYTSRIGGRGEPNYDAIKGAV